MGIARKMTYNSDVMATAVATKQQKFSLEGLRAGDRLLKAIKDELGKKGDTIDYKKLRKEGYSDVMIERLKKL
jgi:hypothetical protein